MTQTRDAAMGESSLEINKTIGVPVPVRVEPCKTIYTLLKIGRAQPLHMQNDKTDDATVNSNSEGQKHR